MSSDLFSRKEVPILPIGQNIFISVRDLTFLPCHLPCRPGVVDHTYVEPLLWHE